MLPYHDVLIKVLIITIISLPFCSAEENHFCEKDFCESSSNIEPCRYFQKAKFTNENASLFMIEAKGRLGQMEKGEKIL